MSKIPFTVAHELASDFWSSEAMSLISSTKSSDGSTFWLGQFPSIPRHMKTGKDRGRYFLSFQNCPNLVPLYLRNFCDFILQCGGPEL